MSIDQNAQYLFYVSLVAIVAATIGAALWAARDAGRRSKSPVLVFLLVFLLQFPFGLIAWLIFRPAVAGIKMAPTIADDPDADLKRRVNAGHL